MIFCGRVPCCWSASRRRPASGELGAAGTRLFGNPHQFGLGGGSDGESWEVQVLTPWLMAPWEPEDAEAWMDNKLKARSLQAEGARAAMTGPGAG